MGFETVYAKLQQLFPQIDARLLRAVSIQHSKDVDAAVVAVLEEIVPFFTERSTPNSPLSQNVSIGDSSEGNASMRTQVYDKYDGNHEAEGNTAALTLSVETHKEMKIKANKHSQDESRVLINENRVETHQIGISAGIQTEGTALEDKYPESGTNILCDTIPQPTVGMDCIQEKEVIADEAHQIEIPAGPQTEGTTLTDTYPESGTNILCDAIPQPTVGMDCIQEKEDIADGATHDISVHTSGSIVQLVETPGMCGINLDKSELSSSTDSATNGNNISSILGTEDDSTLNATMSTQIGITDVIDEVIADARNNKKTLFLEMESVINLMKQVEVKEQAAEQAKTEAATGGMDLLNEVQELKRMLQHAKEANDMHAGEVYGEKAILATELRELQSRVRSLSDERDVSLAILNEIRQSLEIRLSAAMNEIKSAELRKLEKEEVAQKSLAQQKLIMEKVVQESKILKQQAEDNAKLEEFLLDRGRVVDTLQGEIAVICQDVKQLKERFDQHVPLGKSLFSSQTSFMLASLASSLKSLVPDQVETEKVPEDESETENNQDHEKVPEDGAAAAAEVDSNAAVVEDDGWEFFKSSDVDA